MRGDVGDIKVPPLDIGKALEQLRAKRPAIEAELRRIEEMKRVSQATMLTVIKY